MLTVGGVLHDAATEWPEKTFLYFGDEAISYREVDERSDRVAAGLLQAGLKPGHRLALLAWNQPEWLYTFFGAAKAGIGVVALNVRYRKAELEYMINNAEAKAFIGIERTPDFDFIEFFDQNRDLFPTLQHSWFIGDGADEEHSFQRLIRTIPDPEMLGDAERHVGPEDLVILIYTSGTTGRPKGAMITHRSILASARAAVEHFKIERDDVFAGHLPMNHVGGVTCTVMEALWARAAVVLVPSFRPDTVLEAIEKRRVTVLGGVPTMFTMMFAWEGFPSRDVSSVRLTVAGGSNVEPQLARELARRFSGCEVANLYGLSETSGACVLTRLGDGVEKVAKSIGVAIGDFQARIVDDDGNELPEGQVGELMIGGACVAKGYYGMEEETRQAFPSPGWVRTGDMAYVDSDGYLYVMGRKKEMYIQGGFNVYPVEVENVLTSHPGVLVAAGIGVPDPVFGEVGRYYIIPKPGIGVDEEELIGFCRERLADFKVPKQFVFVRELPLTPAGKVHKALLKEQFLKEHSGGA
ncbi:class I adenylate-forming enzyme family protein [Kyrpidia spormannii]|uniref:Long-chain fatty acid--CoA ligase n=1 Tax=Kyrpidia spormannii TaxID=2055160 RepID=A0ACA8ZCS9_9BACL|nr:AMP-binding protein [Kyrpidia spormannii]CAB3392058.1 Long-chain fatty acid--CoA ligase [Kyrpidia spormannii]